MEDKDNENKISLKLVKLPVFEGSHMVFHTLWFHFHAFATIWKLSEPIGKTPEADSPATVAAALSSDDAEKKCQLVAKKHNAIVFANLMTALDSYS